MQNESETRRILLRRIPVALGIAAGLAGARHAQAASKMAQKTVAYRDTPNGTQRCDNCKQWVAPDACKVVEGTISPAGWCQVYAKMPPAK
jgi:hypothetical protein